MSDSDSFINEVSEEVRRDQLFGYIRKYGWIAVAVVALIVGGAAYNEYSKAQTQAAAEAAGDAMLAALAENETEARSAALSAIETQGPAAAVTALLTAATQQEAGQISEARATLADLAANADVPAIYRDLAAFKAALLPSDDAAARKSALEALAQPGARFALLAQEQLGLMQAEAGDKEGAIATMKAISDDAGATRGLRERAQTLIVALGGTLDAAVTTE